MLVQDLNWIAVDTLRCTIRVKVKIRSRANLASAELVPINAGVRVIFDYAQKGIAPGQAAVFYEEEKVFGAGIISNIEE